MFSKLEYIDNCLYYDGVNLLHIEKNYRTPIYIYSKNKIIENYNSYVNTFQKNKYQNFQISFAMKANENSSIIEIIKDLGGGVDVVSIEEVKKAIYIGIQKDKIVFSGVGKTKTDIEFAIRNRIGQINIESYEEFLDVQNISHNINKKANIAIRINPNIDANTNAKITTGKSDNKFGVSIEIAEKIILEAKNDNFINLLGISVHIGSQILDLKPFEEVIVFLKKLYTKYSFFKTIDFGGGLGIQYDKSDNNVKIEDYVNLMMRYFSDFKGKIIIEPGRSIVGNAGIFLTKVIRIKKTEKKNFIIVNGGMNNLIRPAMYNAFHYPMIVKKNDSKLLQKYDIVGPICESSDVFVKNFAMNDITNNDENYIAFLCAGAYGSSMSNNYNLQNIAGELLIDNGKVIEIKKPISFKHLLKFEKRYL